MREHNEKEITSDIELLKDRFLELDEDIKRPYALSGEVLRQKLTDVQAQDPQPSKRAWWKPVLACAATFVVVIGAVYAFDASQQEVPLIQKSNPEVSGQVQSTAVPALQSAAQEDSDQPEEGQAYYAEDYTQVRDIIFEKMGGVESLTPPEAEYKGSFFDRILGGIFNKSSNSTSAGAAVDMAAADGAVAQEAEIAMDDAMAMPNTAGSGMDYSQTNVQETGVDEADVVKTDGEYLYSYVYKNSYTRGPTIFITDAQDMKVTSKIILEDMNVNEFYLSGDYLVTVGYGYAEIPITPSTIVEETDDTIIKEAEKAGATYSQDWSEADIYRNSTVQAVVYDVSNKAQPKKVRTFNQDGDYISSRVKDGVLYLVSTRWIYPDFTNKNTPMSEMVPIVYDGASGAAKLIPADQIAVAPKSQDYNYAIVSSLDIKGGGAKTQAVLGGGQGIYMSNDNLYVYYTTYNDRVTSDQQTKNFGSYSGTNIIKFAVNGLSVNLKETAYVDGYTDGQFAFSEHQGNLRVATTAELLTGYSSNNVYVLDQNMKQIGKLEDLAPGERIYSVRYMDDMAYVVTFRETDPLFAIDLSDPTSPKVMGQLKIPGFSEYLHPIDDHTLIGIGQDTDINQWGGVSTTGLKVSMFDVSDPLNPRELHVYNLGVEGSYSEALYNHKAVMFNLKRNLMAFPASVANTSGYSQNAYYVLSYSVTDGFELKKSITHGEADTYNGFNEVNRGQYIGNILYTFSPEQIVSYDMDAFTEKDSVLLK